MYPNDSVFTFGTTFLTILLPSQHSQFEIPNLIHSIQSICQLPNIGGGQEFLKTRSVWGWGRGARIGNLSFVGQNLQKFGGSCFPGDKCPAIEEGFEAINLEISMIVSYHSSSLRMTFVSTLAEG